MSSLTESNQVKANSTKLAGIEAGADVTDATNVAAAGAPIPTGTPDGTKFLRDDETWQAIAGGGDALVANPLSQFAATTSLQLAGVISDETGSGDLVFATSPTLVTPALGTPASGDLANCTGYTADDLASGTLPAARLGADSIDAITEIAAALKTGSDTKLVTGTAGATGNLAMWDVNGDAVDSTLSSSDPQFTTIELGATDTTLSRSAAGVLEVEGQRAILADGTGQQAVIGIACSDETTAITTGTAKATFRMPYAMTLTEVRASVTTAPTGSTLIIDINDGGTTIMTTNKLSIDASEKTSETAATAHTLTDTALGDDAEITIDFDQVGATIAGAGVKVHFIGTRT